MAAPSDPRDRPPPLPPGFGAPPGSPPPSGAGTGAPLAHGWNSLGWKGKVLLCCTAYLALNLAVVVYVTLSQKPTKPETAATAPEARPTVQPIPDSRAVLASPGDAPVAAQTEPVPVQTAKVKADAPKPDAKPEPKPVAETAFQRERGGTGFVEPPVKQPVATPNESTRQKLARCQLGSTYADVKKILGKPDRVEAEEVVGGSVPSIITAWWSFPDGAKVRMRFSYSYLLEITTANLEPE